MNKIACSVAAITVLIATHAVAADMAVKSAPAAPSPTLYNWTGWYVGVNVGASFGDVKTDFAPITLATTGPTTSFSTPGLVSNREYPDGFMGGGQIGYNWQVSPIWVLGVEADFQGAIEKDHNSFVTSFSGSTVPFSIPVTGTAVLDYTTKIDWFGTVRGRIGYVWGNGNVMSYLTGGFAYAKVDLEGTNTISGAVGTTPFSTVHAIGHSHTNTGWVVGYGTEGVIDFWGARNWTWKIEGLYMDFGHLNDPDAAVTCGEGCRISVGQTFTQTHFKDGILRGGLNYKFF